MAILRLLGGALVVLLAVPLVLAAPATGRIEVDGTLHLNGPVGIAATGMDMTWNATGAPTLLLEADTIRIERYGTTYTVQQTPVGGIRLSEGGVDERVDHAAGTVRLRTGEGLQLVVIHGTGEATLDATDADVRPVQRALIFHARATDALGCQGEDHCLDAFGVYAVDAASSAGRLEGDVTLYLRGPQAIVSTRDGETTYASGTTTRESGTATITEETWIAVTAKGAILRIDAPAPVTLFSATPHFTAGEIEMTHGTGALSVGTRTYRAHDEAIDATGAFTIAPLPLAAAREAFARESGLVYGDRFTAEVSGDVASINLRAAPVYTERPAQTAGILAAVGALLGGLAYFWPHISFHATSAALPFYTRLKRPDLLENDVRNAIYDIIRANPGISARAVQRESVLSWGTVVYHLRQLERHHLVVSRALGRTRNYYENHGKYKGMEIQLACLQSPRALALARLILKQPGMTQEALAQASGFPQPTTSYYVRKLKQANLVEEHREGRYAHYLPNVELARYVSLADDATPADDVATVAPA